MKNTSLLIILMWGSIQSDQSFLIKFQDSGQLSDSEWAEFTGSIPHLAYFTVCHWEKLEFFNLRTQYIWNYCSIMNKERRGMACMQMWYMEDITSAWKNIKMGIKIGDQVGYVVMKNFLHRSWNYFCWSYSSYSGESRLYMNGKLQGVVVFVTGREIEGDHKVYDSSFSLGQDPDMLRGGYDKTQAFRGSISGLNMWDYVLTNQNVSYLAACKDNSPGNIIAWDVQNFKLYNVSATIIENTEIFCTKEEHIVVFPEKMFRAEAIKLCQVHGGYLYTPRNAAQNKAVMEKLDPYMTQCLDQSSDAVAWIGASVQNFSFSRLDEHQNNVHLNYSNLNKELFESDMSCVSIKRKGLWEPYTTCNFEQSCVVCGFLKTPVFSLKGRNVYS